MGELDVFALSFDVTFYEKVRKVPTGRRSFGVLNLR